MKEDEHSIEQTTATKRTRRSFLVALLSAIGCIFGWMWLTKQPPDSGIPWPFRSFLKLNESLWRRYYSTARLTPQPPAPPPGAPVRLNGDLGLTTELASWKLHVAFPTNDLPPLLLSELTNLRKTHYTTEFKCIEGWTEVFSYGGIRFSDFLNELRAKHPDESFDYPYVGLETPDRGYYVSIDMESMLHPQTLLAFEMNSRPLSSEHGAPLRLVIPVKYGIKSLKRVGRIRFSDERLPDYWAERGYDWYAGL